MTRFQTSASYARRGLLRLANSLDGMEKRVAPRKDSFSFPPTFIIGAPRSGSTLFYQTLVNAFRFGYLSNLHCHFYGCPYLLQRLLGRWLSQAQSPYQSQHGHVDGLMSPSECGQFWYRWFRRRPQYVPLEEVNMCHLHSLRRVLIGLTDAFGLPLLFKNMLCALRLQPLSTLLPEARFLFINRSPLWTAQSLLLVRQQVHGDKHTWWSMEPPEVNSLRYLSPEEQVVRQVDSIHRLILNERERAGPERFLEVRFEDFCQDVPGMMQQVQLFLSHSGVDLVPRFQVPRTFPISNERRLPEGEFDKLRTLIKETFPDESDL